MVAAPQQVALWSEAVQSCWLHLRLLSLEESLHDLKHRLMFLMQAINVACRTAHVAAGALVQKKEENLMHGTDKPLNIPISASCAASCCRASWASWVRP